ncbi:MAG: GntR family transcriptional regulator, partial [Janthinobacterium lividum]
MMTLIFELRLTPAAPGSRDIASTLYRQLKEAILDGRLRTGARLPSTRSATTVFGVSRNTTQDVYDRLAHEALV